jgi:PAS domain S-box-containing protein
LLANRVRNAVEQARARERADERERVVGEMNELAVIVQDGTIRYTSPGVSELLGYPEDHPIGREMTAFVAPDSRDTLRERHQRWMEGDTTERPNQHELSLLSADGERVPVEVSVSRIEYRGRPATLSIVRDITERRHQQQRFQAFIEHSTDIITVLDADGTYKYQSPSSKRVLGYEPEEMVGDNAFDYVHPDDRDDIVERFGEAVSDPEMTPVVEYRLRHENGSWRWMESVGNNQLDNPAIEGFVVNSRDITDRKQKEQALQRQNERLERFASVVSHDLRNPLSVAEGHLELLSERCDSDRIDSIEQAHERMRQLIDDILSLAREGEPISDTESAHLPTVAERSWQGVSTSDATLSVETDLSVLADRSRLTQLFENLFRNAIEHGGEDVTVTVTDHQARGGFTVADDGTGIPEESRETIFEPGFSTTDDGTGFGLPIVREIAEAHGWEVEITESDTGGARFEVVGVDLVDR